MPRRIWPAIQLVPEEAAAFSSFSSGAQSLWTDVKGALGIGPGDRKALETGSPWRDRKLALGSLRHAWRTGRTAHQKPLPD